jgi:hypothetical protein
MITNIVIAKALEIPTPTGRALQTLHNQLPHPMPTAEETARTIDMAQPTKAGATNLNIEDTVITS